MKDENRYMLIRSWKACIEDFTYSWIQPVIGLSKMTSKCYANATNVFGFKRASREYLARLNRSPLERVMDDLLKPRRKRVSPEKTRDRPK